MKSKNLYTYSKCPNCDKYTVSFRQKMNFVDYRYTYTCKECGGTIQLPVWHSIVYLSEIIMFIAMGVKFNLNAWQVILTGIFLFILIGIVGIFEKNKKKGTVFYGILINLLIILWTVILYIFGDKII